MITVGKLRIVRCTGKDLAKLRADVFERDSFTCQACGKGVLWHSGHMAHIIGRGRGGSDVLSNCRVLCATCHLVGEHNRKSVPSKI